MAFNFCIDRFHAKEYPAYDKEVFPYYMGYCQTGIVFFLMILSLVEYDNWVKPLNFCDNRWLNLRICGLMTS